MLRTLTGCDTALPVEGDRMSSPPPISVMSCTGVHESHPAVPEQAGSRGSTFSPESAIQWQLHLITRAPHRALLPRLALGCPHSEAGGRTWLSFSRMAEKRGVRVPETTLSGSLYPHLERTWSASECTSATSCSACMHTLTQAQQDNRQ